MGERMGERRRYSIGRAVGGGVIAGTVAAAAMAVYAMVAGATHLRTGFHVGNAQVQLPSWGWPRRAGGGGPPRFSSTCGTTSSIPRPPWAAGS